MKNQIIKDFVKDLGSNSSAPGGGAAAGLVGAVGVALTSMVYSLTVGKKAYEILSDENKALLDKNLEEAQKTYDEMLDFMNKDEEAFTALMDCYKLPKDSDEEKNIRSEKITECTVGAMMVPLELSRKSLRFFENIKFAVEYGNKNLLSDAVVSAIMISACIDSSIVNVEVNLAFLKDEELIKNVNEEIFEIRKESNRLKEEILSKSNFLQS
ncbi:cyclodeaminase/cyclohydrolase family protein [Clostridium sp. B9]|uniref:cyclodeaminase/cyclohydrolase family protein n=1 Tax=Clostridium sp. B9 TaxID=3423224 RepID=UPI003D2ED761